MNQLLGNVDVDDAVNKYAKMLSKYVTEENLPEIPKTDLDKEAYTTRYNSVLLHLVPDATTTMVAFMGKTKDGIGLRFYEAMEFACSERMNFIETLIIKTLAKKRQKGVKKVLTEMIKWD